MIKWPLKDTQSLVMRQICCHLVLQKESAEYQDTVAAWNKNLIESFGADSEQVLTFISRRRELDHQLEEAGKLAAVLQDDADDRDRRRSQLDDDIESLTDWISDVVDELNELSVIGPSESVDELVKRHHTVKVMTCLMCINYASYVTTGFLSGVLLFEDWLF